MPYAIKDYEGTVIIGTTATTESDAWGRWCSAAYVAHHAELGYTCVPVTVSEGDVCALSLPANECTCEGAVEKKECAEDKAEREADALLQDILDFLNADGGYAIYPSSSIHKRIDAYLKGKP